MAVEPSTDVDRLRDLLTRLETEGVEAVARDLTGRDEPALLLYSWMCGWLRTSARLALHELDRKAAA